MSAISKERVKDILEFGAGRIISPITDDEIMELARIALASFEAEPVAYVMADDLKDSSIISTPAYRDLGEAMERTVGDVVALFTAPPAPVSVMDEDLLHMAASAIEDLLSNEDRSGAGVWADVPAKLRRAAMLQSFGNSEQLNSPVIPDCWVACSERMPESDDFVYILPRPDFGVELHVAQYGKFDKRDAGWYAQVYEQNYGIEYYPVRVTHWMPLPAAPRQDA
ncbi:DUF551 domain-containing protein [Klebsiella aerogenes]|uniref:DUF551 domain-containing protein n=1 Tax=Klebsiella aerogenes TaxID=548 RepID=UPI001D0188CF|nr:DUF551 domain-containing protein [Klebsiella aerogenes]